MGLFNKMDAKELFKLLKPNPENPRTIKTKNFELLKNKIADFPQMMAKRPIVFDSSNSYMILGGNRRFDAVEALLKEGKIEIKNEYFADAKDWTPEQKRKFIVIDNISDGEWDYEKLATQYEASELEEWGLPVNWADQFYTRNVTSPVYEPGENKPDLKELVDREKAEKLIEQIESSKLPDEVKEFLKLAAGRHYVFNYAKIADYYAHADKETQELMENSALVIIDYNKAMDLGFIRLTQEIAYTQTEDYSDESD